MDLYEVRKQLNEGKTIYDMPLRVTFYARVSTEKDAQLHSLSAQVTYFSDYIQRCGMWSYVEGYVDEGISGTGVEKRESFLKMIADAKKGEFDFIVTKEISRFSRNTLDSIHYSQELLQYGVGILFQSDHINTLMPDAELRLTIMSSIAQEEVRKISERVKFGFKRAIEKGVVLGNSRIWGYQKKNGKLVIEEKEAEVVRLIFELYANQKMGIRAVANYLTDHGYQNQNGNDFSFSTIRGIISNPKYKGFYCGGKTSKFDYKLDIRKQLPPEEWIIYEDTDAVPAIVSAELWEKANHLLESRAGKQKRGQGSGQTKYSYSGKLICGEDGAPYYRSVYRYPSGEREVWQCREYCKKGKKGCCAPVLYTAEINQMLRNCLETHGVQKERIIRELLDVYRKAQIDKGIEGQFLKREERIKQIQRRKDKLLDLSVDGQISEEEFRTRNEAFNVQLKQEKEALQQMEAERKKTESIEENLQELYEKAGKEFCFTGKISYGLVDALFEKIEVIRGEREEKAILLLYTRLSAEPERYTVFHS